jgi:hypothetical protein
VDDATGAGAEVGVEAADAGDGADAGVLAAESDSVFGLAGLPHPPRVASAPAPMACKSVRLGRLAARKWPSLFDPLEFEGMKN